jgi:alpha-beta hydrolase superfamily lysophospholipase
LGIVAILATLVCGYLGLLWLIYRNQDRLIYAPSREMLATPALGALEYETVWLDTDDGERLHSWFIPAHPASGTVLFFHGNGGNISHYLDHVSSFHRLGLNTLIVDYRGYGQSSGSPTEAGLYLDAAAAWQELVDQRGIPPDQIIVAGYSLGGAVAVWTATTYHPRALVLESTFTSLPNVAAEHYPYIPVRLLLRSKYPTIDRIPTLQVPVLLMHSHDDQVVPYHHGQQLYAEAPEPKTFVDLQGGHGDGFRQSQAVIETELGKFLTR